MRVELINCENIEADEKLRREIKYNENYDDRIGELCEIIKSTSGSSNLIIYTNYRRLDFYKKLYDNEESFIKEFKEAAKKINDTTKAYTRYKRVSKVIQKLPQGSYLSINIPNSHWKIIKEKTFENLISNWDHID